ncbi:baseplate protein [[Phormidium ambiguum] IAM M-71]|uniref:Baseplate protein n=1 Tax=[Phormidium ambiguum] IAM M-71 TaxID=454136 RepID=A0A1U7IQX9_9CYAN|nr:GPW/gp25 family protein [Phormidium ambiguum]OKH39742.1 baseplate protein [Phormidium ambiguum IAM M-71]
MVNLANRRFSRPYLGQGLRFPLQVNKQGNLDLSIEENSVRESIYIILLTQLGERVYRPDFGCRLSELTFAPMNSETLMLMRIYVRQALEMWEPRIILNEVLAEPDPAEGRVNILISYRLQEGHEQRSIVYPFYLQQESDDFEENY